jgi:hypothetical protein
MYGEGFDTGPITADTRAALGNVQGLNAREALMLLKNIGKEGLSNAESVARGAVAAIPGTAGEIESVFRDDRKRIFANSREVERQYLPKRLTAPTADEDMFTEIGTYINPDIAAKPILTKAVPKVTKGVKDLYRMAVDKFAPAAKVDTFPTSKMSAEELAQYLKAYDPQAAAKAREAFLAPSAEKRRMYHGTFQYPTSNMVTDSTGGLRIMGADQGFTSFKPGTGGMTFVTPQTEFADMFAGMRLGSASKLTGPSRVYPVHVQVKKPFDFENASHLKEIAAEVYKSSKKLKKKEAELGTSWMSSPEDIAFALSRGSWAEIENPLVINAAKKLGFDGMYMMEAGVKNLGIFDPKKIKSAIGNEGTFDVRKPDIRKAEGGVVHRAEGSPIYGEVADSGPITADTRAAFRNMKMPDVRDAREALKVLKRIGKEGVSNLESLARGSVAGVPGVVGDVESIFRDDQARRFATSEEIERQRLPQRMTAPTKEAQGFVEIGTAIDPTIALKAAKPVARATKKVAKELGPTAAAQLERLAPAAQPMYVVKPKGGVFYPEGSGSNLDNYLETVSELVLRNSPNIPGKEAKRVKDLIVNKGRKYFTTTYATGDDPIREALIEGRISLVGRDAKALPRELLRAAQDGDPEALRKIDELYDIRSNIRGEVVSPSTTNDKWMDKISEVRRKQNELMRQEGVPDEFLNTALMHKTLPELREPFPSEASKMLADLLEKKRGPVIAQEKTMLEAVKRGQPIYDVRIAGPEFDILSDSTAAQGIASLSLKDIEKMSYPEMIIRGAQNTLLNRSTEELLKAAREGKSVPKKFFSEGVTPIKGLENTGWVSVDTPFAVQLEGAAMRHSVGDYAKKEGYGHGGKEGFLSGKAKVFSLRPEKAEPVITVESRVDPDGLYISQVKSVYNSLPTPEEKAQIFKLFDNLRDKYGALDFKAKLEPEAYKFTRTGQSIEKDIPKVNWYDEYSNYLQYRNKGAE